MQNLEEVKFYSLYVEENMGWFTARYFNGLFHINFSTGKTKYIGQFPEKGAMSIYREIISYKDRLYFIPIRGDTIGVYNRADEQITCIDIPQYIMNRFISGKDPFAFVLEYCGSIYMFGYNTIVLKLDTITKLLTEISVFVNCEDVKSFSSDSYVRTNENKIYTIINNAKEVIELSLKDFSYRILRIHQPKGNFISLVKKGYKLWIIDTKAELFEYDLEKENCQEYFIQNDWGYLDKNLGQFIWSMYIYEDNIYMIAKLNHASYIFNSLTKHFKKNDKFKLEPHKKFRSGTWDMAPILFLPIEYKNMVYFQWEADLTLRILDLRNNQLRIFPILVNKRHISSVFMTNILERNGLIIESEEYPLDLYLDKL